MARKLIAFHDEDRRALEELAEDRSSTFQELMDEAVRDLLRKYNRPTALREALFESAKNATKGSVVAFPQRQSAKRKRQSSTVQP
jgi:predicted transcriptional regulator